MKAIVSFKARSLHMFIQIKGFCRWLIDSFFTGEGALTSEIKYTMVTIKLASAERVRRRVIERLTAQQMAQRGTDMQVI